MHSDIGIIKKKTHKTPLEKSSKKGQTKIQREKDQILNIEKRKKYYIENLYYQPKSLSIKNITDI